MRKEQKKMMIDRYLSIFAIKDVRHEKQDVRH
ncbi:hypothetical protein C7475_1011451 [Chitinophaga sp. S165]|nr:hypothetical protein C7475_1011451 [Chitinophaga sp. S165]